MSRFCNSSEFIHAVAGPLLDPHTPPITARSLARTPSMNCRTAATGSVGSPMGSTRLPPQAELARMRARNANREFVTS